MRENLLSQGRAGIPLILQDFLQQDDHVRSQECFSRRLSGGVDSSVVSAILNRTQRTTCFTVQFTNHDFYDESRIAIETARHLNTELVIVPVTMERIIQTLPQSIYHAEGLSINGHISAKFLLNQTIKEHGYKVAFSGEGADELLLGYTHFQQDSLEPHILNQQYVSGIHLPDGPTLDLTSLHQQLGFIPTWIKAKSSMAYKLQQLWHPDLIAFNLKHDPMKLFCSSIPQSTHTPIKISSALWMQYALSNYILKVLDDGQSMAHGIEGRNPFLDTRLVEFLWSTPDKLLMTGPLEKMILRNAFKTELTSTVYLKPKQSFMAPTLLSGLLQKNTKAFIYEYLLDNPYFTQQCLFSPKKIETFLQQCRKTPSISLEPILATILSLSILCGQFKLECE